MKENRYKRRTREEVQEMFDLYEKNKSLKTVGKEFGLTRERVRQLFVKFGFSSRKFTVDRSIVRFLEQLKPESELRNYYWEQNKTIAEIAAIYQISKTLIRKMFFHYEIPLRSPSQLGALYVSPIPGLNKENLQNLFIEKDLKIAQIAEIIGCAKITVAKKLQKFGIRKYNRQPKK